MGMEDEARNFLVLIMQTVSTIILWLLINIFLGLYMQYGMFENSPNVINLLYYVFFSAGCYLIFRYFKKRWKEVDL